MGSLGKPKVKGKQISYGEVWRETAGRRIDTCAPGHNTRAGGSLLSNAKKQNGNPGHLTIIPCLHQRLSALSTLSLRGESNGCGFRWPGCLLCLELCDIWSLATESLLLTLPRPEWAPFCDPHFFFFAFYWRIITELSYSSVHISFQSPNAIAFSSRIHSASNSNIFLERELFLHRQSNQDVNSGQHTGHTALRHLCLLDHFSNNLKRLNLENSLPNVYLDSRLVIYRGKSPS